jgi:hypothetical protein
MVAQIVLVEEQAEVFGGDLGRHVQWQRQRVVVLGDPLNFQSMRRLREIIKPPMEEGIVGFNLGAGTIDRTELTVGIEMSSIQDCW